MEEKVMKRWTLLLIMTLVLWGCALQAFASQQRSEALQLYQEGLFQETGTGDVNMAITIYTQITSDYSAFRDIAAVAYYHLGLLHEKLGQLKLARKHFTIVVKNYVDQKKLSIQAKHKLRQIRQRLVAQQQLNTPTGKPTPQTTPTSKVPVPKPVVEIDRLATLPSEKQPMLGIGINVVGLQIRYRTVKNLQLEFKSQARDNDFFVGTRCSLYSDPISDTLPLAWYTGVEYDWVFDNSVSLKYLVGAFLGTEWTVAENIGLGVDAGYYYENVQEESTISISSRVLTNVYITFYF
jgi:Tetratricopeptide repeat